MSRLQPVVVLASGVVLLTAGTPASKSATARFHHLHLVSPTPETTVGFYERRFPAEATRRVTMSDAIGIEGDGVRWETE